MADGTMYSGKRSRTKAKSGSTGGALPARHGIGHQALFTGLSSRRRTVTSRSAG
jgi:hypothetical protein